MMNIECRTSTIDDAKAIADVHVRSRLAAYADILPAAVLDAQSVDKEAAFWREALKKNGDNVFVAASEQGELLGFVGTGPCRTDADNGEIYAIYIDPDYFRQGIGRKLWQRARNHLHASGFTTIVVLVIKANQPTRRFYEAIGFELVPDSDATFNWHGASIEDLRYEYRIS